MRRSSVLALLGLLGALLASAPAHGSPYFLVDSAQEWAEAMSTGHIQPMGATEWQDYMSQWGAFLQEGEPYPTNEFRPPELYVWPGGGGGGLDPEDAGLVMVWQASAGSPGHSFSSAWKYEFLLDPDLTGCTINITVTAPQFSPFSGNQVNDVSFGIRDAAGNIRSWHWNVGQPGDPIPWNTPTQITINPMILSVNAANPVASGFANNPFFNITQSIDFIVDENAIWVEQQGVPPPGQRIPNMWNYWHDLYVTPPIPGKNPDPIKWSQPPVEMLPPTQPPLFYGWDERSLYKVPPICADDWECTDERPVTDVHWWGSFLGWTQPVPPQFPLAFHLGIWTDVPAGPNNLFSHPGVMIWEHVCDTYTWNFAGYDYDPRNMVENEACFQFHQYIPQEKWFRQDPGPNGRNVYWLSIAAIYDTPEVQYPWGWKTRPHFFNDDAVRIQQVFDPSGMPGWPPHIGWHWAQGQPITWMELSYDLAFELTTNQVDQYDWGDAPDGSSVPMYPTLAIHNGANHLIVPRFCLGNLIDAENDGIPDANALGDDNNNVDDEDGVTFNTPLIPGSTATVTVNATVQTGVNAFLNAWIDFNCNHTWEASEQIIVDQNVVYGPNTFAFTVPPGSTMGAKSFARFRLSTVAGLGPAGPAPDGEVEDYEVPIGFKWVQKPDLTPLGMDVNATMPRILADDFLCTTTGPITDIHIWGSWYHDLLPGQDPGQVKFKLSIHKDIPAGPGGEYSRPGEVLWYREFLPGQFRVTQYAGDLEEGWMNPPSGYEFPADRNCWLYEFVINEDQFIQRGDPDRPVVYWLDVQAEPLGGDAMFGWKTSLEHWNDDAVWGYGQEPYLGPWYELRYPSNHEMHGQSIDLAFAITGKAGVPVGTLTVKANHSIYDHFWWRGDPDPDNEMASLLGVADAVEGIFWTSITLQASGSGNDATDIAAVNVWADNDNNGKVTSVDTLLGTGVYPVDNGAVTIWFVPAPLIPAGGTFPIVVSYTMSPAAAVGSTYQFTVVGASGTGQTSGMPVTVVINPVGLASATKIVGPRPISIGTAKRLPIGTQFLLDGKICTANFQTNMGLFYIEEPDRSAGIGVNTSGLPVPTPVNLWDRVSVLGVCSLINGTELVVTPQQIAVGPGLPPWIGTRFAVGMNNKWTGGGVFGGQPAVYDDAWTDVKSTGLNNVGMLITTWGEVTYHQTNFPLPPMVPPMPAGDVFWINDGTNLLDGTTNLIGARNVGIAVWLPSGYPGLPNPGEYWGVTGILRTFRSPMSFPTPEPVRLLIPRLPADLVRYK